MTAECTTDIGALRFPRTSQPVPAKSSTAEPVDSSISTRSLIFQGKCINTCDSGAKRAYGRPIVKVVNGRENVGPKTLDDVAQEIPHGHLGVGADVVHVILHGGKAVVLDDYQEQSEFKEELWAQAR